MNLVAHYHLDRTLVNSYFVVGAATPDLLSIYNSQVRIKQRHLKKLSEDELGRITPPFLAGLQKHFFADGIFHTSPLFHQETKRISNMLVEYFPDLEIQRKFFIGHILLELMISTTVASSRWRRSSSRSSGSAASRASNAALAFPSISPAR